MRGNRVILDLQLQWNPFCCIRVAETDALRERYIIRSLYTNVHISSGAALKLVQ